MTAFRYLSNEEFSRLTKDEKISYLAQAIQAVTADASVIAVIRPPEDMRDDDTQSG